MAHECVALNSTSGTDLLLLNDGTSCVLLNNPPSGIAFHNQIPTVDLRGISTKKKKRKPMFFPFIAQGKVAKINKLVVEGRPLLTTPIEVLARVYNKQPLDFYGKIFKEGGVLITKSRVMLSDYKLRESEREQLRKLYRKYMEIE